MEVKAVGKYVRVQPRKVRIVADELRGKPAAYSAALLRYHQSKASRALRKVLVSAMSNAQENHGLAPDAMRIASITVDEGPRLKRIQARAMGRAYRIVKKSSHITVVLEDYEGEPRIKPHGTKAKPRPSFEKIAKAAAKKKKADEPTPEDVEATAVETMGEGAATETPVEEAPVSEAPVEEAPVEEAPVEEAPVETPAEPENEAEAPAEEPATEAAPAEEPAADEAQENEPNADSAPTEDEEKKGEA
jgi:large subunit ribosomal protein L22